MAIDPESLAPKYYVFRNMSLSIDNKN
ncbi:hypothetical protein DERF_004856 [Dermatophagoides farinae]|uniref:Uncharacterized protein n=1 Tax=Dermatophagoides farinae TaxID=6954 RepID=A0A922L6L4_DERFA|nr:hypothetical protein DERF_004856 [Dermatophagoides farinae]